MELASARAVIIHLSITQRLLAFPGYGNNLFRQKNKDLLVLIESWLFAVCVLFVFVLVRPPFAPD